MDVLFPLLAVVFLVLFLVNRQKANKARAQFLAEAKAEAIAQSALLADIERLKAANLTTVDEKAALAKEVAALGEENLALAAFKGILDAKREADRILLDAKNEADEAQRHADQLRNRTEADIRILLINPPVPTMMRQKFIEPLRYSGHRRKLNEEGRSRQWRGEPHPPQAEAVHRRVQDEDPGRG